MVRVTATEFAKNFGRYREEAQREPVAITSHGRTSGYFVSAYEYAELVRLRAFERRVYRIEELPENIVQAITESTMDPKHDHLNALLDE
ncbi:MAG: type II toxin-antitoxin system Phd/YefM family antitoxin [Steroidobacteraceae bacterium]|nr:type II toxin-antitoxin system Phd/YefM family antitoxin [Pseudomonadota bacterium]MBP7610551.1 type II toxin-antitoxin system Phd/YefM family antitoxin [Steroidobacteraceae bacterium]